MHIPVLLKEVIAELDPQPGQKFIDGTINGGGHALAILEKIKPNGRLLGIEWDSELYQNLKAKVWDGLILINDSYANLKTIASENDFLGANGILLDLGMSSWQLESSGRGFSFQKDEILDMRYQTTQLADDQTITAADIINTYPKETIEEILKNYGEERFARPISEAIIVARKIQPIVRTFQLIAVIKSALQSAGWRRARSGRIHFATKTFQALRMAVNHELENLETGLRQGMEVLQTGGRMAVITFHSLEDRIVKNFFREQGKAGEALVLTKKPLRAEFSEIKTNPRARSAKLRVIQKT